MILHTILKSILQKKKTLACDNVHGFSVKFEALHQVGSLDIEATFECLTDVPMVYCSGIPPIPRTRSHWLPKDWHQPAEVEVTKPISNLGKVGKLLSCKIC